MISFLITIIKVIFLLGFLIIIHEGGHFLVAKLCKVKVNEFAVGFGPVVWKKQGKETKYAIRLIPLGGFVSMEGEEERSDNKRSFSNASISKRIAIVLAGATVNIIFGIVVYFILMASTSTYITNEIGEIYENYPAQEIGIQQGDKIIEVNNQKINDKTDLNRTLKENEGKEANVKIERNNEEINYNITPKVDNGYYYLGVGLKKSEDTIINHIIFGVTETKEFLASIGENLKQLLTGNIGVDQMVGPVGIGEVVSKTSGIFDFIYLLALISLSLGITNLLPIPALDGGKILILIIEAIRRKPMKQETESYIQLVGFTILIMLSIYVTYNDIMRI